MAVCKKYYVHPELMRLYLDEKLEKLLCSKNVERAYGLSEEEEILMKFLDVVRKNKVSLMAEA